MNFSPTLLTFNYEGKLSGWINFYSSGPSLSLGKARVIGTWINEMKKSNFQSTMSLITQVSPMTQPKPKGKRIYLNENNLDKQRALIN